MLILESGDAADVASLVERVRRLETDAEYRASFFAEPVLAPGAEAWLQRWCDAASRILRQAIRQHPLLKRRFPEV